MNGQHVPEVGGRAWTAPTVRQRKSRPRETLGWETPAERLVKLLATAS